MIVIATHAVFFNDKDIYGPPHAVSLFLNKRKIDHIFIKHRLEGHGNSKVEFYEKGKLVKTINKGLSFHLPPFFQYPYEIFSSVKVVLQSKNKCDLFIGVDSLNALSGIILKFMRKTPKSVYFSADFALKRFENSILNGIYLGFDSVAVKLCNQTWSVSKRIVDYRNKKGLVKKKNIYIPNAPPFFEMAKFRKIHPKKNQLVIVSKLYSGVDFTQIFLALKRLVKSNPDIVLHVVGDGEEMEKIKKEIERIGVGKYVIMYGAKDHEFVHSLMASSMLGFALYKTTDKSDFRYFSDSMKIRDYLACGTPVIATGNTITGEELQKRKAGVVVHLEQDEIYKTVKKILTDERTYSEMKNNGLSLAEENDIYTILSRTFNDINVQL